MALAEKGSRPITVGDQSYRWALSPDSGYNVLVVQSDNGNTNKLRVYISDRRFEGIADNAQETTAITPGLVNVIIQQALQHGWQANDRGRDFVGDLMADDSLAPRTTP